jgi:hypothetical protein
MIVVFAPAIFLLFFLRSRQNLALSFPQSAPSPIGHSISDAGAIQKVTTAI